MVFHDEIHENTSNVGRMQETVSNCLNDEIEELYALDLRDPSLMDLESHTDKLSVCPSSRL